MNDEKDKYTKQGILKNKYWIIGWCALVMLILGMVMWVKGHSISKVGPKDSITISDAVENGSEDKENNSQEKYIKEEKALEVKATPVEVANIAGIESNMLISDYWINKLEEPHEVLLDSSQIARVNNGNIEKVDSVYNLYNYPQEIGKDSIVRWINEYKFPRDAMYNQHGIAIESKDYEAMKNNLNISAVGDNTRVRYGVIISRTAMKRFPSDTEGHKVQSDKFDRFQETALDAGEKVIILHISADNKWSFVQAYNYRGWVRNLDIATSSEENINYFTNPSDFVVVLEDAIKLQFNDREYKYFMGTKLPIAYENEEFIVVYVPITDSEGKLIKETVEIPKNLDVSKGYLDYTRANFINQAFKLLGTTYEWGDRNDGRDCSSTVASIYKTFGIYLPRNTDEQEVGAGKSISLKDMSIEGKKQVIGSLEPGDIIFMNGHVVMYLGKDNCEDYIIHNFSGIYINGKYDSILRTAVTEADMMVNAKTSYLDLYTSVLKIDRIQ